MNRKQFLTLLILVVILGGAGLFLSRRYRSSWHESEQSLGQRLLSDFPINNVTHIAIRQNTNEVNLVKKEDIWRVRERADYPANFSSISDFLIKLRDMKIVQREPVGPSQLPRLELAKDSAGTNAPIQVEFRGADNKLIRSLLLGKKHMRKPTRPSPGEQFDEEGWPDGRYVMVDNDAQNAMLISDPLTTIEPKPEQWLNKEFFKIEKIRSIEVEFPNKTNSWKLTRENETGDWKLADAKPGEQLDSSKTSGFSYALSSPSFIDVTAPDTKPDYTGMDQPTLLKLETFDELSYMIKVGKKTNENYYLSMAVASLLPKERTEAKDEKPEDKDRLDNEFKEKQKKLEERLAQERKFEKWIYLVSSWTVDSLLKERSNLLAEKKEENKAEGENAQSSSESSKTASEKDKK